MTEFTHLKNNTPHLVNVDAKDITKRKATARCEVIVGADILDKLLGENMITKKGAVEHTAILAGIMGAKKTSELIPLCHPLMLEQIEVNVYPKQPDRLEVICTAGLHGKTGVEMEALTGAAVAALTIYDMCKALSHDIVISGLELIEKSGGKQHYKKDTR